MRSSDWSSAVCSSDLRCAQAAQERPAQKRRQQRRSNQCPSPTGEDLKKIEGRSSLAGKPPFPSPTSSKTYWACGAAALASSGRPPSCVTICLYASRSEEHTSELQSLMRISYAVFCLKKKKKLHNRETSINHTNT